MQMYQYEVKFTVDGKPGGSVIVTAPDGFSAKRVAQGQVEWKHPGKKLQYYASKLGKV